MELWGFPSSSLLHWYPVLAIGTHGTEPGDLVSQGTDKYLALGGEFPTSTGWPSRDWSVRDFDIAPNKRGPVRATRCAGTDSRPSPRERAVGWQAPYDMDDETLTYSVIERALHAGLHHNVEVELLEVPRHGLRRHRTDPWLQLHLHDQGDRSDWRRDVAAEDQRGHGRTTAASRYSKDVIADGATDYWRLGETIGHRRPRPRRLQRRNSSGRGDPGSHRRHVSDSDGASTFNGGASGTVAQNAPQATTPSFSVESWVKTTTTRAARSSATAPRRPATAQL